MSAFVFPVFLLLLLVLSAVKRISVYDCFVDGAKDACKLLLQVFPYIAAISLAIALINLSGLSELLSGLLAVPLSYVGIPKEITELILLIPVSGNGAVALLSEIFSTYGADSYVARCASTIMGSSETVFYIAAVYFSDTQVRRLRYAIPVALCANLVGAIVACQLCKLF